MFDSIQLNTIMKSIVILLELFPNIHIILPIIECIVLLIFEPYLSENKTLLLMIRAYLSL